jgi:predicted amidohydrolase
MTACLPTNMKGLPMPNEIRVAGIQMLVSSELEANLPKILAQIAIAADDGSEIVLFPEMSLSGYHGKYDFDAVQKAVDEIRATLQKVSVAAIVSTGWRQDGEAFIQQRAYDNAGELLGTHEKMLPTGIDGKTGDRAFCVPGRELRTFTWHGVACGMLICNDMWMTPGCGPHHDSRLMYQLGKMGAQIVFHSIHSGPGIRHIPYHESNISLRAEENKVHVCAANAAHQRRGINCSSGVVTPNGEWITRLNRVGEGRYHATLAV